MDDAVVLAFLPENELLLEQVHPLLPLFHHLNCFVFSEITASHNMSQLQENVAKLYRKFRGPLMLKYLKELAANDQAVVIVATAVSLKWPHFATFEQCTALNVGALCGEQPSEMPVTTAATKADMS